MSITTFLCLQQYLTLSMCSINNSWVNEQRYEQINNKISSDLLLALLSTSHERPWGLPPLGGVGFVCCSDLRHLAETPGARAAESITPSTALQWSVGAKHPLWGGEIVMRSYQSPVNTAAVSYTVIGALWNVEVARPINPCESLYLSISPPPPPLSNVGRH